MATIDGHDGKYGQDKEKNHHQTIKSILKSVKEI